MLTVNDYKELKEKGYQLKAIKTALAVPDARYLLFNAFDTVVGALYVLFMMSAALK